MTTLPQPDSLYRYLFEHAPIRGEFVHLDHSWRNVIERHVYSESLRNIMGELYRYSGAACRNTEVKRLAGAVDYGKVPDQTAGGHVIWLYSLLGCMPDSIVRLGANIRFSG